MTTRPTPPTAARHGLSLVEVLIAVGLCAVAVLATVALFGPAVRATRDVGDQRRATRVVEAVERELHRGGFRAASEATAGGAVLELVAAADASRVVLRADVANDPIDGAPPGISVEQRYFDVEIRRAVAPPSEAGCLVLEVRISWPASAAADSDRSEFRTLVALNR